MAEFINIYAGALVALSSLRDQAGSSGKARQPAESGGRPADAAGDAASARPETVPARLP